MFELFLLYLPRAVVAFVACSMILKVVLYENTPPAAKWVAALGLIYLFFVLLDVQDGVWFDGLWAQLARLPVAGLVVVMYFHLKPVLYKNTAPRDFHLHKTKHPTVEV